MNFEDWFDHNIDMLEKRYINETSEGAMLLDDDLSDIGNNPGFQDWCKGEYDSRDIK